MLAALARGRSWAFGRAVDRRSPRESAGEGDRYRGSAGGASPLALALGSDALLDRPVLVSVLIVSLLAGVNVCAGVDLAVRERGERHVGGGGRV